MSFHRSMLALMSAVTLGAFTGVAVPAPSSASNSASQQSERGILPAKRHSRRAQYQNLFGSLGMAPSGGRQPWVNQHGYMLRQVRRPVSGAIR